MTSATLPPLWRTSTRSATPGRWPSAQPGAPCWCLAQHYSSSLTLSLPPASEFVMAAKYRLGCKIYEVTSWETTPFAVDIGERASVDRLCDALHDMTAAAALSPVKERRFLLPGVDRHPSKILISGWASGREAALDITVIYPIQQDTSAGASVTPGFSLNFRYSTKMTNSGLQEGGDHLPAPCGRVFQGMAHGGDRRDQKAGWSSS